MLTEMRIRLVPYPVRQTIPCAITRWTFRLPDGEMQMIKHKWLIDYSLRYDWSDKPHHAHMTFDSYSAAWMSAVAMLKACEMTEVEAITMLRSYGTIGFLVDIRNRMIDFDFTDAQNLPDEQGQRDNWDEIPF